MLFRSTVNETFTVTAQNGSATKTYVVSITRLAASLSLSTVAVDSATVTADGTSSTTIRVQLKDSTGTNLTTSGGTLTFASAGIGTITNVVDNGDGTYTAKYTAGTALGTATITASINNQAISSSSPTISLVAGAAAKMVLTTSADSAYSGYSFGVQPVVQLRDAFDHDVTTSGVAITVSLNTGSFTSASTTTINTVNGVATFSDLQIDIAGIYTLSFDASALTSVTQTNFTVGSGDPFKRSEEHTSELQSH